MHSVPIDEPRRIGNLVERVHVGRLLRSDEARPTTHAARELTDVEKFFERIDAHVPHSVPDDVIAFGIGGRLCDREIVVVLPEHAGRNLCGEGAGSREAQGESREASHRSWRSSERIGASTTSCTRVPSRTRSAQQRTCSTGHERSKSTSSGNASASRQSGRSSCTKRRSRTSSAESGGSAPATRGSVPTARAASGTKKRHRRSTLFGSRLADRRPSDNLFERSVFIVQ